MIASVPELAETIRIIIITGAVLGGVYLLSVWYSVRAKRLYRQNLRDTERSLIGERILVIKTIKPPQAGEIVTLDDRHADEKHSAYARQVLWAGQRGRVINTTQGGYLVAPLDKTKS